MNAPETKTITSTQHLQPKDEEHQSFFPKERPNSVFSNNQKPFFSPNSDDNNASKPFFNKPLIQTKLTIDQPGDKYEQEADAMAEQVVQKLSSPNEKPIQRQCAECEQEEQLQKKEAEEEEPLMPKIQKKEIFESNEPSPDDSLQAKSDDALSEATPDLESRLNASKGSGSPLPEDTRTNMESSFGADFNGVRIHTGSQSVQMNQELEAKAFTAGNDIHFSQGEYNPGSQEGKMLLAHELTHVIQQNPGNKPSGVVQLVRRADQSRIRDVRTALSQSPPDFISSPSGGSNGGAFFILNGLSPTDLINVLRGLTQVEQNTLLTNIGLTTGLFDQSRLELALHSITLEKRDAILALQLLDAIRNTTTGIGTFGNAFQLIERIPSTRQRAILELFDLANLRSLLGNISVVTNEGRKDRLTDSLDHALHRNKVQQIQNALSTRPPDFVIPDNPLAPGAFNILNGLSPEDMVGTLRSLASPERTQLLNNVGLTVGHFDEPRLSLALRASMSENRQLAIDALDILDAIRNAGTGSFVSVYALFQNRPRMELLDIFRLFDPTFIHTLQTNISSANPANQSVLTEVFNDILGGVGSPAIAAPDVIDLASISGTLNKMMATIYNRYGQILHHHATTNSFHTDIMAGIFKAESGGRSFNPFTNAPITRFEVHVLWNRWGKNAANTRVFNQHFRFDHSNPVSGHQFRVNATSRWTSFHGNQTREREALDLAVTLAGHDLAHECASFGMPQVMGFNFGSLGFANAGDMAIAFNRSERSQIEGMVQFLLDSTGLTRAVRSRNFNTIGRLYNGNGGVYGPIIQSAANAYRRVTRGKRFA